MSNQNYFEETLDRNNRPLVLPLFCCSDLYSVYYYKPSLFYLAEGLGVARARACSRLSLSV